MTTAPVSGLLLTGGTSRRMGGGKAGRQVGGVPMGVLAGRALLEAAADVLAVGPDPGLGIDSVADGGRGPLAALVAGMQELAGRGEEGLVLLVACDLPFVTAPLLRLLAGEVGTADAAVPVHDGRPQPLAACYGPGSLPAARRCVEDGRLSMRDLLDTIEVRWVPEGDWRRVAPPHALVDVDTPEELQAANVMAEGRP